MDKERKILAIKTNLKDLDVNTIEQLYKIVDVNIDQNIIILKKEALLTLINKILINIEKKPISNLTEFVEIDRYRYSLSKIEFFDLENSL